MSGPFGSSQWMYSSASPGWLGGRGVFMGGYISDSAPQWTNQIDYITIASTGNSLDFGDIATTGSGNAGCSNGTRGVSGGGYMGTATVNVMEYITIANTGNTSDFGDLSVARRNFGTASDGSRGVWAGGNGNDVIDYVTIDTTGNATDFGNLLANWDDAGNSGIGNATRGVFGGGARFR